MREGGGGEINERPNSAPHIDSKIGKKLTLSAEDRRGIGLKMWKQLWIKVWRIWDLVTVNTKTLTECLPSMRCARQEVGFWFESLN